MKETKTISVLIVDDHPMVREGMRLMLQSAEKDIWFKTDEAEDGQEAIKRVIHNHYDVIILDYKIPGENGDLIIEKMLTYKPDLKILAVSNYDQLAYVKKMVAAGAKGYILKNIEPAELVTAIKTIMAQKIYYSNEIVIKLLDDSNRSTDAKAKNSYSLSGRQLEILKLIAEEKTNEEIAGYLSLSKRTIDTHRERIMQKVQARNTAGLIKAAYELKLIEDTNKIK